MVVRLLLLALTVVSDQLPHSFFPHCQCFWHCALFSDLSCCYLLLRHCLGGRRADAEAAPIRAGSSHLDHKIYTGIALCQHYCHYYYHHILLWLHAHGDRRECAAATPTVWQNSAAAWSCTSCTRAAPSSSGKKTLSPLVGRSSQHTTTTSSHQKRKAKHEKKREKYNEVNVCVF